ncbi:NADH-quinone oxidoreductase subunit C [Dehalobacterium formicoaceticum]|uniref:NADH-quinone oxidoreductase subunit C n=1 Tax=Dehalobacterium formicoaceticum TaxID=51515 RepID=UPI000B7CB081|nr:NADH-quinone oxidoreductase subunit C [Dehalobacterium formicoaceticum]
MNNIKDVAEGLITKFGTKVGLSEDEKSLVVAAEDIIDVLQEIKENTDYTFLEDVTAVDYPECFTAVYHLLSLQDGQILRVKANLDKENPQIESAVSVWNSANVMERETYDLMGIIFTDHPDLKRVLCPDDFEGHPLRKDFKVEAAPRQ